MKKTLPGFWLALLLGIPSAYAENTVSVSEGPDFVFLKNEKTQVGFNLKAGMYFIKNAKDEKVVDFAAFQSGAIRSSDACESRTWTSEDISDNIGKGKALTIKVAYENYPDTLWQARIYEDKSFVVFNMGIENDTKNSYQLTTFDPLMSKQVFNGKETTNYRILDGNSGGSPTKVTDSASINSFNNVVVKFGQPAAPQILAAGGISYNEFEKFVQVNKGKANLGLYLHAEDPVGRLIDAGQKYWLNEKFYICLDNKNPFEALEKYADVLKAEQQININYYDFPTECLWYAAHYNNDITREKFNNSKGAVEEMDNTIKSGITRYAKAGIRLVPDAYGDNNQQGWWDDKHWAMYNEAMSTVKPHYTEPYLTTKSWSKAILDKGGIPFTYMQSGRRSEDFVKLHPDWMLFNDPHRPYTGLSRMMQESTYPNQFSSFYNNHWWTDRQAWSYDFTDPGFIKHMQGVYANLKEAGIKGIFYDYPESTAWAYEGGFENKHATTALAYRNMFELARDGMGKDVLLQERNIVRGSDIALGLVDSQRVWGDTDQINPEMVSRCGLRWYKNRKVISYDMDSKDPSDALPAANNDGIRAMVTMCYVTSGRFLLGRSFIQLSPEQLHDLSRTFPYHTTTQSARPIDAFNDGLKLPQVYDFAVNPSWHQLTFYNGDLKAAAKIGVSLGTTLNEGGLELDSSKEYYAYDFWNNRLIGLVKGSGKIEQDLRAGEARMISLHAKEANPQFISTNRHIMQGFLDLKNCQWDGKNSLKGQSAVIEGDTYKVVIAQNGYKATTCTAPGAKCSLKPVEGEGDLVELTLETTKNATVSWSVQFEKK